MSSPQPSGSRRPALTATVTVALFAFFCGHIWLRVDPRLVYQAQSPVFMTDQAFFAGFLDRPGGLVEYASAFLAQSCARPSLGALVVTSLAFMICLGTGAFIARLGGVWSSALALTPAVGLLILHSDYIYPLSSTVGLLAAVGAVNLYMRGFPRRGILRPALFAALSCVLYYVAAAWYLSFAAACVIVELLVRRKPVLAACLLAIGLALPWAAARYVFEPNIVHPWTHLLWLSDKGRVSVSGVFMSAVLPLMAIVVPRCGRLRTDGVPRAGRTATLMRLRPLAGPAVALLAAALATLSHDRDERAVLRVDRCAQRGDWPAALEHARLLPARRYRITTRWDVNRALFHTGRLGDEMFAYPQDPSSLLVSNADKDVFDLPRPAWARLAEVFLDLGRVAEAQFRTHEAMEHLGQRPEIIRQLFLIYVIKHKHDPARIALNALGRHLLWAAAAQDYQRRLAVDPDLSNDSTVQRARSTMITEDHLGHVSVETMLRELLERNPRNRMAREYLVGHYLLTRQLPEAAARIRLLSRDNDGPLPGHYEEAIFLHARSAVADVSGVPAISDETQRRGEAFFRLYSGHRGDRHAAQRALAPEFGDTYFFYYTFGETGSQYAFATAVSQAGGQG